MLTLGEKIKNIRISNNLKQSELAEMLFVSEKTISSWENNRTVPDLNMIYKISDYYMDWLGGGSPYEAETSKVEIHK